MRKRMDAGVEPARPTRRQFVQGVLTAGFLTSVGAWAPLRAAGAAGNTTTLSGADFDLTIGETAVNLTGRALSLIHI